MKTTLKELSGKHRKSAKNLSLTAKSSEADKMSNKQIKALIRIIITAMLMITAFLCRIFIVKYLLFIIAFIIIGYDVIISAFRNLFRGHVLDENFLMSIATIGAFAIDEYRSSFCNAFFQNR